MSLRTKNYSIVWICSRSMCTHIRLMDVFKEQVPSTIRFTNEYNPRARWNEISSTCDWVNIDTWKEGLGKKCVCTGHHANHDSFTWIFSFNWPAADYFCFLLDGKVEKWQRRYCSSGHILSTVVEISIFARHNRNNHFHQKSYKSVNGRSLFMKLAKRSLKKTSEKALRLNLGYHRIESSSVSLLYMVSYTEVNVHFTSRDLVWSHSW